MEVRSASTPPHPLTTSLPIQSHYLRTVPVGTDGWGYRQYRTQRVTCQKKVKQTVFIGGRIVQCLSPRDFKQQYGVKAPKPGVCLKIREEKCDVSS